MGKGGMRYGAGRPAYRLKAEQLQRVDVRIWARRGYLRDVYAFTWSWNRGGEHTGSIGVYVHSPDVLTLRYTVTQNNEARDVVDRVTIARTVCPFGGTRPWFNCTRCTRRVAVLYMRWGYFACRHCQRVSYTSQSGSAIDRVCNRFHRLADKVENGKPKWQRWATYNRLFDRYLHADEQFNDVLEGRLRALGFPDLI
jgi:hypothetical protein